MYKMCIMIWRKYDNVEGKSYNTKIVWVPVELNGKQVG